MPAIGLVPQPVRALLLTHQVPALQHLEALAKAQRVQGTSGTDNHPEVIPRHLVRGHDAQPASLA
jgi:hypothetical protein